MRQETAMSLLECVSEILRVIPGIQAAEVRLDEKHGIDPAIGLRLFDPKSTIRMLENNPEAEKLKQYLSTVDYETLLKLEALMVFGRDRDATFAEKIESCRRRKEARSDIVRTLLEKVPACGRYLSDAVERLLEEGADVGSL